MIKNFRISSLSNEINVEIDSDLNISQLLFFKRDTFDFEPIDITGKLTGTYPEQFTIRPEDVDEESFTDIYFLNIIYKDTEECNISCEEETGVAVNTTKYYDCILNLLLGLKVDNCNFYISCKSIDIDKIMLKQLLLDSIFPALQSDNYKLAIKIFQALDDLCFNCSCYEENIINSKLNTFGIYTTYNSEVCEIGNIKKQYGK